MGLLKEVAKGLREAKAMELEVERMAARLAYDNAKAGIGAAEYEAEYNEDGARAATSADRERWLRRAREHRAEAASCRQTVKDLSKKYGF